MPRFYFDTFDGQEWIRDEAGVECPTSEMAIKEARETLPEIVQEEWPNGQAPTIWIRIRDEANHVVGIISLDSGLKGPGEPH